MRLSVNTSSYKGRSWKAVSGLWYEVYRNLSKRCYKCWGILHYLDKRHIRPYQKGRDLYSGWLGRGEKWFCSKYCAFFWGSSEAQERMLLLTANMPKNRHEQVDVIPGSIPHQHCFVRCLIQSSMLTCYTTRLGVLLKYQAKQTTFSWNYQITPFPTLLAYSWTNVQICQYYSFFLTVWNGVLCIYSPIEKILSGIMFSCSFTNIE